MASENIVPTEPVVAVIQGVSAVGQVPGWNFDWVAMDGMPASTLWTYEIADDPGFVNTIDIDIDSPTKTMGAYGAALSVDGTTYYFRFRYSLDGNAPSAWSTTVSQTFVSSSPPVTWNPGWYMSLPLPQFGDLNSNWAARQTVYNQIANETAIVGVQIYVFWADIEAAQGDYSAGIAALQQEINYLKNLAIPKRLWVRLNDQAQTTSWGVYFPPFYGSGQAIFSYVGSGTNGNFRRWDATNNTRYNAMLTALGTAFNDEPYFEGISINKETAIGGNGSGIELDTTYSAAAYFQALKDNALAAKAAFPNKNVSMHINDISYSGNTGQIASQIQWCADNGIGVGGPDVAPEMTGSDGVNGTPLAPPDQKPNAYNYLFGNAYLGQIPITYSVETSELGNAAVSEFGGYTTQKLFDFATQQMGMTHIFWARRNFTTTDNSVQHLWEPSMGTADEYDLPFIQANPWPAANKVYPSTYPSN